MGLADKYPWLCNTVRQDYVSECANSATGNMVSEQEGYNTQGYTTDAYGTYGLKFTYYKVSHSVSDEGGPEATEINSDKTTGHYDPLYGEDQVQEITRAFYINGYTEQIPPNVLTYQLQGIWGEDILTVNVGRAAFQFWSTYGGEDRNTAHINESCEPRIGDLCYLEPNHTFYEIVDVKYYQNAFGLMSQTFTLTMRVYKDAKYSIKMDEPTLADRTDPIFEVAPSGLPAQYQTKDPLALNDDFADIKNSRNVNMMDPRISKSDPSKSFDPFYGW